MMPPVLKVLSLITTVLCVVLIFGAFVLDDTITYSKNYPKITFKSLGKQKVSSATSSQMAVGESKEHSTSTLAINLVQLQNEGTYFNLLAESSSTIEFSKLERLGGNYYKTKEGGVYYFFEADKSCGENAQSAVAKLDFSFPLRVTEAQRGNVVSDGNQAYLHFLKINDVDQKTFSYVGIANRTENEVGEITTYWYKDKNKVFSFIGTVDPCKGFSFNEEKVLFASDVDVASFEYIGSMLYSQHSYYARDKNYFYNNVGKLSETITPKNCTGDFWKDCFPKIEPTKVSTST